MLAAPAPAIRSRRGGRAGFLVIVGRYLVLNEVTAHNLSCPLQ